MHPSLLMQGTDPGLGAKFYSYRSETIGSTRIARRAGIQQARQPTIRISAAPAENVHGSLDFTPYNSLAITRTAPSAPAAPSAAPHARRVSPCPMTIRSTSAGPAPNAIRTPISRVRRATEYDTTP